MYCKAFLQSDFGLCCWEFFIYCRTRWSTSSPNQFELRVIFILNIFNMQTKCTWGGDTQCNIARNIACNIACNPFSVVWTHVATSRATFGHHISPQEHKIVNRGSDWPILVWHVTILNTIGRFRKHDPTSNRDVIRHHWPRRAEPRMLPEEKWRYRPSEQGIALRRRKRTLYVVNLKHRRLSRLTGSRAQAIPRHVTSRFDVALCFLNLPNVTGSGYTVWLLVAILLKLNSFLPFAALPAKLHATIQ